MTKNITLLFVLCFLLSSFIVEAQTGRNTAAKASAIKLSSSEILFSKIKPALQSNVKNKLSKKAGNKLIETESFLEWNESASAWDTSFKYIITRDGSGEPTQLIAFGNEGSQRMRYIITGFVKIPAGSGEGDILEGYNFQNGTGYVWMNNAWVNNEKFTSTFSSTNLREEEIMQRWVNNAWVNFERSTFTYNANNNVIMRISYDWMNNAWVNDNREETFYDAKGRYQGFNYSDWRNGQWISEYSQKNDFTYDANNNVTTVIYSQFDTLTNQWAPMRRQSYILNTNGEITEITEANYNSGAWMDIMQYKNISWKTFDKMESSYPFWVGGDNYISYDMYNWNGSSWDLNGRSLRTYNSASMVSEAFNLYSVNGTSWDTSNRSVYTYYPNNDLKEFQSFGKNNNVWELNYAYDYVNTYDADGDMLTNISRGWNSGTQSYENEYQTVYTYFATSGIENTAHVNDVFSVFPNPANGESITLKVENNTASSNIAITVYNQVGQLVMQENVTYTASEIKLNVSSLSKGIYILNMNNGNTVGTSRLVIQ